MMRSPNVPIASGEDSFLDIIANLVGVLVILVAVVGTQAKTMILRHAEPSATDTQLAAMQIQAEKLRSESDTIESNVQELELRLAAERNHATMLAAVRHQRLVMLELAKRELATAEETLDARQRRELQDRAELAELSERLETLQRQVSLAERPKEPIRETIEHFPSPIAKTVFSDEIHFRLQQGHLVYVPLDELAQQMRSEWKVKAEKLARVARTRESVGPVDDFRLDYELVAEEVRSAGPQGSLVQTLVRLDYFEIIPTRGIHGETVEEALQANSKFRRHLARMVPEKTTVSIWVYPESFDDYNQLRKWLRSQGFQSASWPLSPERHISGSPDGLRTSAQ